MDLNELLHAHQLEVMNASASGNQDHFRMIAEYADRIGKLRRMSHVEAISPEPFAPPTIIYGSYAGNAADEQGAVRSARAADNISREQSENPDQGGADA